MEDIRDLNITHGCREGNFTYMVNWKASSITNNNTVRTMIRSGLREVCSGWRHVMTSAVAEAPQTFDVVDVAAIVVRNSG